MLDEFRETAITWDKASRKVYEPLRASAGDNKGRKLSVQVVNNGVVENLSGATLSLYWETKSKTYKGLDAFAAVNATKGEFEIYYTTGMLSNEGTLNANLVLVDTSGRLVSEPFTITVFKGIDDDAIQSSDSFTALTEAMTNISGINFQLARKIDKGSVSVRDIDKNKGKLDQTYMTEEFLSQMAGNAPIHATPDDRSVTRIKLAYNAVGTEETGFLNEIEADDNSVDIMPDVLSLKGDFYDPTNGQLANNPATQNFKNSGPIPLTEKGILVSRGNNSLVFFNNNTFLSSTQHGTDELPKERYITPPENANAVIANVPKPYWWDSDDLDYPDLTATLRFIPIKTEMKVLRVTEENLEKIVDPSFAPVDVFGKMVLSENGKMIDVNTGNVISQTDRKHSDWVDVLPVAYKSFGVAHVLFKMTDGTFIKNYFNFHSDEKMAAWQSWTPPKGAVKMAVNLRPYYSERAELFQVEPAEKVNTIPNLAIEKKLDKIERFKDTTIIHFGDSIAAGNGSPSDIATVISQDLGSTVINAGFGGTRAAKHPNEHFNNFSFHKIVDAIISGNFSAQEASALVTGIGMPAYFKGKIPILKNINFNGKRIIIVISYGTNDWNGLVPIDNPNDTYDVTTYLGSIRYGIRKLQQAYPHLQFVLSTPIYRFKEDGSEDSDTWVAGDKKLIDFVDALIAFEKEIKFPVADCYYKLGINLYNRLYYFPSVDGTHPNYKGRVALGHRIANVIRINF